MVSLTLDALAAPLDRSLLHVFVAGPGYGEGIAAALLHSGWIVLDGCRVSTGRLPILAILDRWRASTDLVEALLLTHPHTDHAFGIRETIENTAPRRIGVTTSPTGLMTAGSGRTWWISPFNRGRRLPPTDPDGVPRLVALNGAISLTATPRPRAAQPRHTDPAIVPVADLPALFAVSLAGLGAFSVTPPDVGPLEPVWCGAFDDRGTLRAAWRGPRAFTVVP